MTIRQMTVRPLARDPGPCRCDTAPEPHPIRPECYLPGRPPRTGPVAGQVQLDPLELADRLDVARAEGYADGVDDAPPCDGSHCPDDCDGTCQSDDTVQIEKVLSELVEVKLSRRAREALSRVLSVPADEIGEKF